MELSGGPGILPNRLWAENEWKGKQVADKYASIGGLQMLSCMETAGCR